MSGRPPLLRHQILRRLQEGPAGSQELATLIDRGVGTVRFAIRLLRYEGHTIRTVRRNRQTRYILEPAKGRTNADDTR